MYAHTYMHIYTYKHLHIYTHLHIYFINITYIFPHHSTIIKTVKTWKVVILIPYCTDKKCGAQRGICLMLERQ